METLVEHEVATFGIKVVTGNFLLQECTGSVGRHGASIESYCLVLAFPLADVFTGQAGHVSQPLDRRAIRISAISTLRDAYV